MKRPRLDRAARAATRERATSRSIVFGARIGVGLMALLVALFLAPRPALADATLFLANGGGVLAVATWVGSAGDLDNVTVTYLGSDTYQIRNPGIIINVTGSAPGRLTVTGSGTDTVTVTVDPAANVTFTFDDGGSGNTYTILNATVTADRFRISNTSAGAGSDTITVATQTTQRNFIVDSGGVSGNRVGIGGTPVELAYSGAKTAALTVQGGSSFDGFILSAAPPGITSIALRGGADNDSFGIQTTPAGVSLSIDGEGGDNSVTFGDGSLAGITTLPPYTSTGGTTNLTVDGSTEAAPKNIVVTNAGVTGLASIPIPFTSTPLSSILLEAGNGANTFAVNYTAGGTTGLNLISGAGNDTFTLADGADLGSGDIDGGGGTNTLDYSAWTTDILYAQFTSSVANVNGVSFARNFQVVNGGSADDIFVLEPGTFTVNGNAGQNRTDVNGVAAAETYTISAAGASTLISRTSATPFTTTLTSVAVITLFAQGGNDTVTIASTLASIDGLRIEGGDDDDTFIIGTAGSTKGLFNGLTVVGGTGTNTLTVDDSATATPDVTTVTGTLIGGGGSDTLFPPGVSVGIENITTLNLLTGTAADTVTVTPSATTAFVLNGGAPSSSPGDVVDFILTGVTTPSFTGTVANGLLTSGNRQNVTFTNFETPRANGAPLTGTVQFSSPTYTVGEATGPANIAVTRTFSTLGAGTVNLTPSNGTATAGSDFDGTPITITFADGASTGSASTIPITSDTLDEANETVNLALSDATGAVTVGTPGTAVLTITDDAQSGLSIGSATVTEGNSGTVNATFAVMLSPAVGQTVTVNFATADGAATVADSDYVLQTGSLSFAPGETTKTVSVVVNGDTKPEPNETFTVTLSGASNATIGTATGTGTISNDDTAGLSIDDVTIVEGNDGTVNAAFTVTLAPASTTTVTVVARTANGTATAGSDYTAVGPLTVTFTPGTTTRTVTVPITGDANVEPDEDFFVNLSDPNGATISDGQGRGVIRNDDSETPLPKPNNDDDDKKDKSKETDEQRQQRERTNTSNRDDYYTEGDVLEVHLDAEPPYIVIGTRDGRQQVNLLCGDQCPTIRVGDYVEIDGEKQHEGLFDALEVTVRRRR